MLFRKNTYISLLFSEGIVLKKIADIASTFENDFLKFYVPDFLWGFSLCFGLFLIFEPKLKGTFLCCITSFLYGTLWEILQMVGKLSGTGDYVDILMYLMASMLAATIYLMRRRKNEKNY